MTALIQNLATEQGATFSLGMTWFHEANPHTEPPTQGEPFDFATCTARMQIRKTVAATEVVLEATTENGMIELGMDGRLDLLFPPDSTDLLVAKSYVYDLELVEPDGMVTRLMQGRIINSLNVTR